MIVGSLEIQIRIEGAHSLKEKRNVVRSLVDRARRDFHVSAAEVDDHDLWNVATIGVAYVTNNPRQAESVLQSVIELFEANPEIGVESIDRQISRS